MVFGFEVKAYTFFGFPSTAFNLSHVAMFLFYLTISASLFTLSNALAAVNDSSSSESCNSCTRLDPAPGAIRVDSSNPANFNITATVIPHITQFANGTRQTSYETKKFSVPAPTTTLSFIGDFTPVITGTEYVFKGQTLYVPPLARSSFSVLMAIELLISYTMCSIMTPLE